MYKVQFIIISYFLKAYHPDCFSHYPVGNDYHHILLWLMMIVSSSFFYVQLIIIFVHTLVYSDWRGEFSLLSCTWFSLFQRFVVLLVGKRDDGWLFDDVLVLSFCSRWASMKLFGNRLLQTLWYKRQLWAGIDLANLVQLWRKLQNTLGLFNREGTPPVLIELCFILIRIILYQSVLWIGFSDFLRIDNHKQVSIVGRYWSC